mmetsp:Transcript_18887/g.47764  ORF Transcript_18887/g.47764 Transcript_18887/m.47764 type:complete len:419 (-) Transcript_18887:201-1457(-)
MISLFVPPSSGQLARMSQVLRDELGTASNIKDRQNRNSVISAIKSAQHILKQYQISCPAHGLAIFCGEVVEGASRRKVATVLEPPQRVSRALYRCGDAFAIDELQRMLNCDGAKYGYVIIDGSGYLLGTISGESRAVLLRRSVCLPNKHRRGGQSAGRFFRLRLEKRQQYVKECAVAMAQSFISDDKACIKGLFIAGSADLKLALFNSDALDPRLKAKVIELVDISYGGEAGFREAINATISSISAVKLRAEAAVLGRFMNALAADSGLAAYGWSDIAAALEQGAVAKLILWDRLAVRVHVADDRAGAGLPSLDTQASSDEALQSTPGSVLLAEWLLDNATSRFGAQVCLVSDRLPASSQFVAGFGGLGALLRWPVAFLLDDEAERHADESEAAEGGTASLASEVEEGDEVDWDAIGF